MINAVVTGVYTVLDWIFNLGFFLIYVAYQVLQWCVSLILRIWRYLKLHFPPDSLGEWAVIIGLIVFVGTIKQQRNHEVWAAWQTITSAYGQSGSGGRIQALEFLNSRPWRFPYFWYPGGIVNYDWSPNCSGPDYEYLGFRWNPERLRGLSVPNAYLGGIELCGADLAKARLEGAELWEAHLEETVLVLAHLEGAFLGEAHLEGADLYGAHFEGADLLETYLQGAELWSSHFEGANLERANLSKALLIDTHFEGANLPEANFEGVFAVSAHFEGASMRKANLNTAVFSGGTNFQLTNFEGALFSRTVLKYADLRFARIDDMFMYKTSYNKGTRFPFHFPFKKHCLINTDSLYYRNKILMTCDPIDF